MTGDRGLVASKGWRVAAEQENKGRGRVVVVGNAGLDLRLAVPRLPLPGETLIGSAGPRAPGGKGLNQAVVAARCGAEVRFCAPLGNDTAEADEVERHLASEGFAELILPRLPHATDFSLLMVLPQGENSIVSTSACSLALSRTQVEPALQDLGEGDVVLLQGNLSLDTTAFILDTAQRQGATTLFNPAPFWPGAEKLVGRCSLVIANNVEAQSLGESIHDAKAALVTLGADGCLLIEREERRAFPAEIVERDRYDRLRRHLLRRAGRSARPRFHDRGRHWRGPEGRRPDGDAARRLSGPAVARGAGRDSLSS